MKLTAFLRTGLSALILALPLAAAAQQAAPAQQQAAQASRGAFGQQVEGGKADTTNRAERRKKK